MTDTEHLTEHQIKAAAEYADALEKRRIAGHGECTRAQARLEAANRKALEADIEASRITRMDRGHERGAPV